jgi:hypothetical protein
MGIDHFLRGYHWIWKGRDDAFANGTSCPESGDVDVNRKNKNNARLKHPDRGGAYIPSTHVTVTAIAE